MKKEKLNVINVLLIVAIVLAVGGTWLNLNKLNEVKKVTLTGYAIGGASNAIVFTGTTGPLSNLAFPGTAVKGVSYTIGADDCYVSSDNLSASGGHPSPCTLSVPQNITNLTFQAESNARYNLSAYYTNVVTTEYGAGTLNHNYIGKVHNISGNATGDGALIIASTYLSADTATSGSPLLLVQNVSGLTKINFSIGWAKEYDVLTPVGGYTNNINVVVNSP